MGDVMNYTEYNYYMDESCYLKNDNSRYMVIGTLCCIKGLTRQKSYEIKQLKIKHHFNPSFEIKSTKISIGGYPFYHDLLNYFLNDNDLRFRAIIIDKSILDHRAFNQTHDEFYYKMTYTLFEKFLFGDTNHLYIDYKDNYSDFNCKKVARYLNKHFYNIDKSVHCQPINSKESNLLQLTDFLIGLVTYSARKLNTNDAKLKLIKTIENKIRLNITHTNYIKKFNIFRWDGKKNV